MIRFFLILLLAAVALSQVVPRLSMNSEADTCSWGLCCDESETEKTGKPENKTQVEDKIHYHAIGLWDFSVALPDNLTPGTQPLYISFFDQPVTPPPNFSCDAPPVPASF